MLCLELPTQVIYLQTAVKTSNDAWNENSALTEEAQKRYETTESKVQILKNTFTEMGLTLYDKVQEPLQKAATKLTEFFQKVSESGSLKDALDKISESAGNLIEKTSDMLTNILPPLMVRITNRVLNKPSNNEGLSQLQCLQ